MNLHASLVWLAFQLQVAQPERWLAWLLRLFVLPPANQMLQAPDPARVPNPRTWAAHTLGIAPDARWHVWVLSLFVRPRTRVHALVQDLIGLAHTLAAILNTIVWLALWPLRKFTALLEWIAARFDFVAPAQALEQALLPVLRIRGVHWTFNMLTVLLGLIVVTTPFSMLGQLLFLLLCWALAMVVRRLPGRYPSLLLAGISLTSLGRYLWWRMTTTLEFDSAIEAILGFGLLGAEAYTWLIVLLGFIQTAWPLERKRVALHHDPAHWPTVDVLIPTYNEPLSVVRPTTLAVMGMDWPRDKLRIFILDDGRREEFRAFAQSMGVGYMVRPDNNHAKAGNLNHALAHTDGELVAIFDCDHMPTHGFLKACVGWFQRDPLCAMLQTPHHFFSPDPFERNLGTFRRVPNEGSLFYGLVQAGNDFWNATFFCGSCAVLRRKPLMEVGGIAIETVTEDAHTALRMHRLGYNTAYINQTLAAGLATESLSAHIGQRMRWARGMAQIFRLDNPFLGKGLTLWQRVCYANAMLHFFFGLPRLIFLTAPMAFLFFEWHIINAHAVLLALYVLPYIIQSNLANAHVQGEYRHSFWAEVYETVLAAYIFIPTTVALFKPRAGAFNVTAKGGLVSKAYFDWAISFPYTILVVLNLAAFGMGLLRLFVFNAQETSTVLLNLIWTSYSIVILGAALGVASESRQVRRTHRVEAQLPAVLYLAGGQAVHCTCLDYSMTGLGLRVPHGLVLAPDERLHVGLWHNGIEHVFTAHVALAKTDFVGVQFDSLTLQEEINLVQCTFARPDAWVHWNTTQEVDKPLHGLLEIARASINGYKRFALALRDLLRDNARKRRAAKSIQPLPDSPSSS
jgi:cellulose synthase (UDP-forming)